MRYVIVGFGRVGHRTARILKEEGHDVTIIEIDPKKCDRARDEGFSVIEGDAMDEQILNDADLDSADAFGGLSGDLNVNYAACIVAANHGCRTVMRIDEDYREEIYQKYAAEVDEIIYPERLGAIGAKNALLGGDFNIIADLTADLSLASFSLPDDSPVIDLHISEIELPDRAVLYAHGRAHNAQTIPLPQTVVQPGDRVSVIAEVGDMDEVKNVLLGENRQATAS
ncbi:MULTISPECIES: TrkA family potassium uptake protein [unclassified Haladaptatus]|uniref:potassium channel family protein n=1 Tax=unclassified Haladaptatus TaxID=2622732 RepID=UPI0023E7E67D|nr:MULTISPECIES: TrkA family potassium uptake protein [unclassified Haladaptatus]